MEYLNARGLFHMDLSLDRIDSALKELGVLLCPAVQVLGTNGKGSTCFFLGSLAQAHGLKTGVFLSPHFVSPRERILVNGQQLSEEIWVSAANRLADISNFGELTYFEILTLLAVEIFHRVGVDVAIMEAGLGGRHDATTALNFSCQCYTPIALDHRHILGPTLTEIARDKAAAMEMNGTVFSAPQFPAVARELERAALQKHCSLTFVRLDDLPPSFSPPSDSAKINAAVALQCWHYLGLSMAIPGDSHAIAQALAKKGLPGRLEFRAATGFHPTLVLDGAHNPHAIQGLLTQIPFLPGTIIYTAMADKDWETCLGLLLRIGATVYLPQLDMDRAANVQEMGRRFPTAIPLAGPNAPEKALALAKGPTLICGSFYLLGEYYKFFDRMKNGYNT